MFDGLAIIVCADLQCHRLLAAIGVEQVHNSTRPAAATWRFASKVLHVHGFHKERLSGMSDMGTEQQLKTACHSCHASNSKPLF